MSATDMEIISYATQRVGKAIAVAPHWQIIATYFNTTMQQNHISSIAFEVWTKEILKDEC